MKTYLLPLLLTALSLPAFAQDATLPVNAPSAEEDIAAPEPAQTPESVTPTPAPASTSSIYTKDMIDDQVLGMIAQKINTELVFFMVNNQNDRYAGIGSDKVTALDEQWVAERTKEEQPLIAATLANPLSTYLMMVQAHSYGLITAIFVMDDKGLNVGQSDITGDYWQGDEAKWQKTFQVGPDAVFIDDPEYDDEKNVWIVQANVTLKDPQSGKAIGAATFDLNLNELKRLRDSGSKL